VSVARQFPFSAATRSSVRPSAGDLIVLFKGMFASIRAAGPNPHGPMDRDLRDRLFAIIADGLRPPG
jgi:hypothetical protein